MIKIKTTEVIQIIDREALKVINWSYEHRKFYETLIKQFKLSKEK